MMFNPSDLENFYQEYMSDLPRFIPDGVINIDAPILDELELTLNAEPLSNALSYQFYVIETADKLTLFNHSYVVWIVPKILQQVPTTYALIAKNKSEGPLLDLVFSTQGIYNHSNLVLRILEKFLDEIEENEQIL